MELIVISDCKFKIMLTAPDMKRYDLNPEEMVETDDRTLRAFRHLLDDCGEIGRDTRGEKLLVQVYASKEGGCEIFVTRMSERLPYNEPFSEAFGLTKEERALKERILRADLSADGCFEDGRNECLTEQTFVFKLENLRETIRVCKRLKEMGRTGGACFRLDGRDEILLRLSLPVTKSGALLPCFWFLREYGRESSSETVEIYIGEYASAVVETGAVELLSSF